MYQSHHRMPSSGFIASVILTLPCVPATLAFKFTGKVDAARLAVEEARERSIIANNAWEAHSSQGKHAVVQGVCAGEHVCCEGNQQEPRTEAHNNTPQYPAIVQDACSETDNTPHDVCMSDINLKDTYTGDDDASSSDDTSAVETTNQSCSSSSTDIVALVLIPGELLQEKDEADQALQQALKEHELMDKMAKLSVWRRVGMLLSNLQVWLLLWNGFLQGFGLGMYQSFLFIALQDIGTCCC